MARRRFRNNPRHEPVTERSFQEYVLSTPALQTSRTEIMRLVRGGEDTFLELKVKLSNTEKIAQEITALANTGGGVIVFGVNDQMRVEGVDDAEHTQEQLVKICKEEIVPQLVPFIDCIAFDNGRRIVALDIDGKRRPYSTREGRFYIRIGAEKREASREELSALMDEARPLRHENTPVPGARLSDIDESHLWSFLREFEGGALDESTVAGYPTEEIMERDLLLATKVGLETIPTVAGLLLFGKNDRVAELIPRSSVVVTRYAGETNQSPVVEKVSMSGNLHTLYESVMKFLLRYCDLWDKRPRNFPADEIGEAPVQARGNYSIGVVREAIANALTHRDLTIRDHVTRVQIFDRSIEVINPRRSYGFTPFSTRAIRYGIPQRLNPELSSIFKSPAYGLETATGGMPVLLRASRAFSGKRADIHAVNDEFHLRIYGA